MYGKKITIAKQYTNGEKTYGKSPCYYIDSIGNSHTVVYETKRELTSSKERVSCVYGTHPHIIVNSTPVYANCGIVLCPPC